MHDNQSFANDFISRITSIVEKNLSNEQFGVAELADELNMSRSNLLRKVRKLSKLSVSQLIRQVRLEHGMNLLRESSLNVSEVADRVGFSSTSYFIKCFREYYGFPPGAANSQKQATENIPPPAISKNRNRRFVFILLSAGLIVVLAIALLRYGMKASSVKNPLEKSIAVLPSKMTVMILPMSI